MQTLIGEAEQTSARGKLFLRRRALDQTETTVDVTTYDGVQARVNGGVEVEQGRYPYLAVLFQRTVWGSLEQVCGGALIAPKVILTASHCLDYVDVAWLGVHDYTNVQGTSYEQYAISSKRKVKCPNYDPNTEDNDFALLFLDKPSSFAPVEFNTNSSVPGINQQVTVIGWGKTESGVLSNVPLEATVTALSQTDCAARYNAQALVTDTMLCASGGSERDSCQGDSGGPLIIVGQDATEDILVGLVSWGFECSDSRYPGVYSRVSAAISWLQGSAPEAFSRRDSSSTSDTDSTIAPQTCTEEPTNCWNFALWKWCDYETICN